MFVRCDNGRVKVEKRCRKGGETSPSLGEFEEVLTIVLEIAWNKG